MAIIIHKNSYKSAGSFKLSLYVVSNKYNFGICEFVMENFYNWLKIWT
jgi:hypothetical protein